MKRYFLFAFFLTTCLYNYAGDVKYPVSAISESLKKKAHVVKRMEEIEFEIVNSTETILHRKYALTILDENGESDAALVEYYDKLNQIKSIEGALYDANGTMVKKLKSKDILDLSAVDDINLIDDSRKKVFQFYYKTYPYTVEFEVENRCNNTLFFPFWLPQEGQHYSVQQSQYTLIIPANYQVHYKSYNYRGEPVVTSEKNKKIMQWQVKDLPAITRQFASPSWRDITTMVYFAPSDFEIQGYKGNMATWKDFGKFQYALNSGRDKLPDNIISKVNELTNGIKDDYEKIRVLYNYLQKNTRYIGIQLGLGGWQPFEANFVAQKGYGDCKALSNYMYSLLKASGIKSNYTLVYAGSDPEPILEDFPCNRFNHVILCVPLQKDTIWLECTSQTLAAGYMSEFTANRKALVIDEQGGYIVKTPRYGLKENTQVRTIKSKLDKEGTLEINADTKYNGMEQDELHQLINGLSRDKLQKILQQELDLGTYNVNDFKYSESKSLLPQVDEQLNITVSNYASISGKRLFIVPNILNRGGRNITEDEERNYDFLFNMDYKDEDNVEIEIPEGYELESKPENISIKSRFGNYIISSSLVGNKIIYHRIREQYSGRYPPKDQSEIGKYYADIYKADRSRFVLVKKGE